MKILIATDGSEFSNAAVEECCKIVVHPENTDIKIVSAFEEVYVMAGEPYVLGAEYIQAVADASRKQAAKFTAYAEKKIREKFGGTVKSITNGVLAGPPEQRIVELAEEWGADMIIVGSRGRGFWGRLVGSVSDAVVHHAPCSVLVVRPKQSN